MERLLAIPASLGLMPAKSKFIVRWNQIWQLILCVESKYLTAPSMGEYRMQVLGMRRKIISWTNIRHWLCLFFLKPIAKSLVEKARHGKITKFL